MKNKPGWIWTFYLIFYFLLAAINILYGLLPRSPMALYYHIALAFNLHFFGAYLAHIASTILNMLAVFPLYLYIRRKRVLSQKFWAVFFIVRLGFDIIGHNYEFNLIKSLWYDNVWLALRVASIYILLTFPSYAALFEVAFGKPLKDSRKAQ